MPRFAMLTRIGLEFHDEREQYKVLSQQLTDAIEQEGLEVAWLANLVIEGPHDFLDLFEVSDEQTARRVAELVRRVGHAETHLWPVMDWKAFKQGAKRGGVSGPPQGL